jgi:hypothetical protein
MATHNTITNVPFSFSVFEAGMNTNVLNDLATAEWQPVISVNTAGVNMTVTNLQVSFESTDTSEQTFTFATAQIDSDTGSPDYFGEAAVFPDLTYSAGVNELTAVTISGNFTYDFGSVSPINGTTAFTAGVRYNSTGTASGGLLALGGANDPSGTSTDVSTFNGTTNTCLVGRASKIVRFGPQKIKFHREYALVTAKCISTLGAPK